MNHDLHLNTPLSKAVLSFFNRAEQDFSKVQKQPGSIKAYIFGGCAMHILTNSRGSGDIDVEFSAARHVKSSELTFNVSPITYTSQGTKLRLLYDKTFSPTLGPLHEDYQDDAIQIETRMVASPLWLYVVTPADLAVSKLGRFGERDIDDILTLIKVKRLSIDEFVSRANEAAEYYVGNVVAIKNNVSHIQRRAESLKLC
ncbi:DUF6036 family nucleotidyltransferase [Agarilytica rhodophyticola]|uniref:DUF6036 family nucleotidyltransferase n=1 Tax=Agarilytica rhodophyticola TaxID=1737490 RepID=UPI000B349AA0|nr:DUF6036 family nucleotidyltransferase [Agarilytica rhodophyticola]